MTISELLLADFDSEIANTRRTLERVPDTPAWTPYEKSMPLGKLAMHCATMPMFGVYIVEDPATDMAASTRPHMDLTFATRDACLAAADDAAASAAPPSPPPPTLTGSSSESSPSATTSSQREPHQDLPHQVLQPRHPPHRPARRLPPPQRPPRPSPLWPLGRRAVLNPVKPHLDLNHTFQSQ